MNKKTLGIGGAICGLSGACIAAFIFLKKKKKDKKTEEVEEAANTDSNDNSSDQSYTKPKIKSNYNIVRHNYHKEDVNDMKNIIKDNLYSDDVEENNYTSHDEPRPNEIPYCIDAFHFGEMGADGYDAVTWQLYSSGEMIDENGTPVETDDVERYVGFNNLSDLGDDESNNTIYIRNDALRMDFEIEYIADDYYDYE